MENTIVDLSKYNSKFSLSNKLGRLLWIFCYWIFFRPFGLNIFNSWRNFILKIYGAKIGEKTIIYASAKVWAPWNLTIGEYSCIGPNTDCYNQGEITIGNHTIISQKTYLCASTHDYTNSSFPLIEKPIIIGNQVWIAADSYIGPGVSIEDGAVVGARSAVFKDVEQWTIVGGNPAKSIKPRIITKN